MTKKKFAELKLLHLHLQHNVEIPETHLLIHPTIQRVVSEALATDTRPYRPWGYATGCSDSGKIQQAEGGINGSRRKRFDFDSWPHILTGC
jgi:hypothetical protein